MSIKIAKSIMLEQDNKCINVCGDNCKYIIDELLKFMKDEYISQYKNLQLSDSELAKCELLYIYGKMQQYMSELENELDVDFMNVWKKIQKGIDLE